MTRLRAVPQQDYYQPYQLTHRLQSGGALLRFWPYSIPVTCSKSKKGTRLTDTFFVARRRPIFKQFPPHFVWWAGKKEGGVGDAKKSKLAAVFRPKTLAAKTLRVYFVLTHMSGICCTTRVYTASWVGVCVSLSPRTDKINRPDTKQIVGYLSSNSLQVMRKLRSPAKFTFQFTSSFESVAPQWFPGYPKLT